MDEEHQAGTRGLKYAADKGLAVVVMEPIRGGQLARNLPRAIMELWDTAARKRTPADWALQWVWNHPEVSLVLSGMSTLEQVKQNVASASQSGPATLTADELALIARVRDKYRELCPVPCTQCKYCLPCPNGVNIPRVLEIYNGAIMYNDHNRARVFYNWLKEEERADACTQCAQCEELCSQEIEIVEWLAQAHQFLGESQNQ
jgi:predicted aldo/keto reductase-like oxidoreductase